MRCAIVPLSLSLQFRRDLGGGFARLFDGADWETDGSDTRVSSAAVAFTDGGEVVANGSHGTHGFEPTDTLVRKLDVLTETV